MKTDNEIIAEFMGYTHYNDAIGDFPEGYYCYSDSSLPMVSEDLKYDTSWDWLMPVVAKIRQYVIDKQPFGNDYYQSINNTLIEVDLSECHLEVVDFIKWYNSQVKT